MSAEPEPHVSASDLADLLSRLHPEVKGWLQEARDLRFGLERPGLEDGPRALHRQLVASRKALDRVETIVADLIRLRGAARESRDAAKAVLRAVEDEALQSRSTGFPEFVSTRERMAWLAGQTEDEVQALVQAEQLASVTDRSLEEARLLYRGIDAVRRDTDVRLRVFVFERSLER